MNSRILLVLAVAIMSVGVAYGVECWSETTSAGCTAIDGCGWIEDTWADNGGWCKEQGCWDFGDSNACNAASSIGCSWQSSTSGVSDGWCEEKGCMMFTNSSTCSANFDTFGCAWDSNENYCYKQSCGEYTTSSTCAAATDFRGNTCLWDSSNGNCYEKGCWGLSSKTDCDAAGVEGLTCFWNPQSNYCEDLGCWRFDNTDSATCVNNTYNLSCDYTGSFCSPKGCYSLTSQPSCNAKSRCFWKVPENNGWCEKRECYNFDNFSAMDQGLTWNSSWCVNTSAEYGLNCTFNEIGGGCFESSVKTGCVDFNGREKDCMDTGYCMYDFINSQCVEPFGGDFGLDLSTDFRNPGCWVIDANQTRCEQVEGCDYNGATSQCESDQSEQAEIDNTGIQCEYINSSTFCNKVPFLGSCCAWNGTSCNSAPMSTKCWDNVQDPGDGMRFCEDFNVISSQTNCNKIAGEPWYMPCSWDNSSSQCSFRMDDKGINDVKQITNKKECEQSGSTWVQEYYCDGNNTIPFGWCETKTGSGAKSCNQQCWACEYQDASGNNISSANAKSACEESEIGYCEFKADTTAPNGIGFCKPKEQFLKAGGDCNTECSACTFMGQDIGEAAVNCRNSLAGCKWISDPDDTTKGWCDSSSAQTCAQKCGSCFTESACSDVGGSNSTLIDSCQWSDGICTEANQGDDVEICFDGVDNNQNGRIDCEDSACVTESFCGGDLMADCQKYQSNDSCVQDAACSWMSDSQQGWCDGVTHDYQYNCSQLNEVSACSNDGNCTWKAAGWCDMKQAKCWNDGREDSATCNSIEGGGLCEWFVPPEGGNCDVNTSGMDSCYGNGVGDNSTVCGQTTGCTWITGSCTGEDWCMGIMQQNDCLSKAADGCSWDTSGGRCEFSAWACNSRNESECTADNGCQYGFDPMMGQSMCMPICFGDPMTGMVDKNTCEGGGNYSICQWATGFCDPVGMKMGDCAEYDTDETLCGNQTGCTWMANPGNVERCEVNESSQCWNYNTTACEDNAECIVFNNRCEMKAWECEKNLTKQLDATGDLCRENPYCTYEFGRCTPSCFNSTNMDPSACSATPGCYLSTGICDNAMAAAMFGNMMDSPPVDLGTDGTDSGLGSHVDMRLLGIKDDKDNYGLGIGLWSVKNASFCNGQVLADGSSSVGNETVKLYWYLDTDGDDSNGCTVKDADGGSVAGFEFKFSSISRYSSGDLAESRTAYKCSGGEWVAAEIMLSSQRQFMCQMLGGGMIAIQKSDLSAFQGLYDATQNMRILAASASENYNSSEPEDSIGPSYYSPGQFDFGFEDCMNPEGDFDGDGLKAKDDPDCSMFQKFGFVKGEDCFSETGDEDGDGLTNCDDPDCTGFWYCVDNGLGVEASNYTDTSAPSLVYLDSTGYPDGLFVAYDSDEPTTSSLMFYGTDSTCNNASMNYVNLSDGSTAKKRHGATLRNISGSAAGYTFINGTVYYYKVKIIDESNNTAVSKCLNATTAADATKRNCPDCRTVVNFDSIPSGWNAEMLLGGTWYKKGNLSCGSAGGMLVWYNQSLNLRFLDSTTNEGVEFVNVTPRTLSGNSRSVADDDMAAGTYDATGGATESYVQADKEKIDELVDKLRPASCRVYIGGNNSELWHCYDVTDQDTCKNRTAESTKIDYNSTLDVSIWEIPKCEFSAWAPVQPATSTGSTTTTSSSSGGGSSGGGGAPLATAEKTLLWDGMDAGIRTMKVRSATIPFTQLDMNIKRDISQEVSVTVKKLLASEYPKFSSGLKGKVNEVIQIKTTGVTDSDIDSVKIRFRVSKSWFRQNGLLSTDIGLFRYTGSWVELDTKRVDDDTEHIYFEATTPGFSYFAIAEKGKEGDKIVPTTEELQTLATQALDDVMIQDKIKEYLLYPIDFERSKESSSQIANSITVEKTISKIDEDSSLVKARIVNNGQKLLTDLILIEAIPKDIIENVAEIREPTPGYDFIIKEDPIIQWRLKEVDTAIVAWDIKSLDVGEEYVASYKVDKAITADDHISSILVQIKGVENADATGRVVEPIADMDDDARSISGWIILAISVIALVVVVMFVLNKKKQQKE